MRCATSGLYHLQFFPLWGKCLVVIFINTCAYAGPLAAPTDPSVSYSSITAPSLPPTFRGRWDWETYWHVRHESSVQGITICSKDINTVFKREHDPSCAARTICCFPCRLKLTPHIEHPVSLFSSIRSALLPKKEYLIPGTADRSLCRQPVHIIVRIPWGHITFFTHEFNIPVPLMHNNTW